MQTPRTNKNPENKITLNSKDASNSPYPNHSMDSPILEALKHYEKTGEITQPLYPSFDQNGNWILWENLLRQDPNLKAKMLEPYRTFKGQLDPKRLRKIDPLTKEITLLCSYVEKDTNSQKDALFPLDNISTHQYREKLVRIHGDIGSNECQNLEFPNLTEVGGSIKTIAKYFQAPCLQHCGEIIAGSAQEINLQNLKRSGSIVCELAEKLDAPNLEKIQGDFRCVNLHHYNLEKLREIQGAMTNWGCDSLALKNLERVEANLWVTAQEILLPKLKHLGKDLILGKAQRILTAKNLKIQGDLGLEGGLEPVKRGLLQRIDIETLTRWMKNMSDKNPNPPLLKLIENQISQRKLSQEWKNNQEPVSLEY